MTVHAAAKENGWWDSNDSKVISALKSEFPDAPEDFFNRAVKALTDAKLIKDPKSPLEAYALIISEACEAIEEARKGTPPYYVVNPDNDEMITPMGGVKAILHQEDWMLKPEGELIELADVVIRVADYCGYKGWDLQAAIQLKHDYNLTRSHRHGGKKY